VRGLVKNLLNKESRTGDEGWNSSLDLWDN